MLPYSFLRYLSMISGSHKWWCFSMFFSWFPTGCFSMAAAKELQHYVPPGAFESRPCWPHHSAPPRHGLKASQQFFLPVDEPEMVVDSPMGTLIKVIQKSCGYFKGMNHRWTSSIFTWSNQEKSQLVGTGIIIPWKYGWHTTNMVS